MDIPLKIYKPVPVENSEICHPVDRADFELINEKINGMSRRLDWKPLAVQILKEDEGKSLSPSDSPWFGSHALVFRDNVLEALNTILSEYGELLPLICKSAKLTLFNPTKLVNALDEDASSITRFSGGRIMHIKQYVFHTTAVVGVDIFKIPNLRVSPTFVSQRFVEQWSEAGLKGLNFIQC